MEITFAGNTYPVKFWRGEILRDDTLTVDTETVDIAGPWDTPDLVLLQVLAGDTVWLGDWTSAGLVEQFAGKRLVMHNSPFDVDVLEKCFGWKCNEHVDKGLLYDTGILFRLRDLYYRGSVGRWSLDYITKILLDMDISKDSAVRLGWSRVNQCHEWPEERLVYGGTDVVATYQCFQAMAWVLEEPKELSHNIQLKGEISLNRITKRGIGFDLTRKQQFLSEVDEHINAALRNLAEIGYVPGMNGVQKFEQDTLLALEEEQGIQLPRSPKTKRLSTKREDLEPLADGSPFISNLLEFKEFKKLRDFVQSLTETRVYPRYDGIKNTGRTSCFSPNIQQLPRRTGVRECFVPKEGHVFVIVDYSMLELVTLAQTTYTLYGFSQMREVLNQGVDLHKWAATVILDRASLDEVTRDDRQGMKAINFGKPGGLGAAKLKQYAKKGYNVDWTVEECQAKIDRWIRAFPEMEQWLRDTIPSQFDWSECPIPEDFQVAVVTRILRGTFKTNTGKPYSKEWIQWVWDKIIRVRASYLSEYNPEKHFNLVWSEDTWTITGRKRARASYNAARNSRFQGLGADVAKTALWELEKKGYAIVAFVHDEVIIEVLAEEAESAKREVEAIMVQAEGMVCPDVKGGVEGAIKLRWSK